MPTTANAHPRLAPLALAAAALALVALGVAPAPPPPIAPAAPVAAERAVPARVAGSARAGALAPRFPARALLPPARLAAAGSSQRSADAPRSRRGDRAGALAWTPFALVREGTSAWRGARDPARAPRPPLERPASVRAPPADRAA